MEKQILNLPRSEVKRKVFARFPQVPGIYIYWQKNTPIYVGKSINLKARLLSYLGKNLGPKTTQMVSEAEAVSFIKVTSEIESLLLEARLIKSYKPRYNIVAKDDKHPLYITISNDELPIVTSNRKTDAKLYKNSYGPFPNSYNVKTILKMIRRVFPYSDHKLSKKPCLYNHLGLCDPCPNIIVNNTDANGKDAQVKKYKLNIRNIKRLLDGNFTSIQKDLLSHMKTLSDSQKFEEAGKIRNQLVALDYIIQPKIAPMEFIKNPNLEQDLRYKETETLTNLLKYFYNISGVLRRIECYDVAHLQGSAATASMVVFVDGAAEKSEYRHFRIRQKKSQSDYDSLTEIAQRRSKQTWDRPDLIIVDGGLGQVKKFYEVFKSQNIPVVGIAKHPDRLIFPDGKKIPAIKLMQQMRDEAHRFARRYHHKLISKTLLGEFSGKKISK